MRQAWRDGDVLKIPLKEATAYCQMVRHPFFAFFSAFEEDCTVEEVISSSIIFRLAVSDQAYKGGRWRRIGSAPLKLEVAKPLMFFACDRVTKAFATVDEVGRQTPATEADCAGLEAAAVWDPEHVEDRLSDYLHGRPNRWMMSLQPSFLRSH